MKSLMDKLIIVWIEMYPKPNLLQSLFSWVMPSACGWEERSEGHQVSQFVGANLMGPNTPLCLLKAQGTGCIPPSWSWHCCWDMKWLAHSDPDSGSKKPHTGLLEWLNAMSTKYIQGLEDNSIFQQLLYPF